MGFSKGRWAADFPISLLATDVDSTLTSASVSVTGAVFDGTPVTASEAGISYDPQTGQFALDFTQPLYQSLGQNLAQGEVKNLVVNLTITDDHGATTTQSPIFTVTGTNDAPVAVADTNAGTEDTTITGTSPPTTATSTTVRS